MANNCIFLWILPLSVCATVFQPILKLNSLETVLLPSSEAARVNLTDFFLGEDLTFTTGSSLQVTQRADFLSSTRLGKSLSVAQGSFAVDSQSDTACILRSAQLQYWDISDLHTPQLINSTELSSSSSLSQVVMFSFAGQSYALVTGSTFFAGQVYLVRLGLSLTLLATFPNSHGFTGVSVDTAGNAIQAYLRTTKGELLLVKFGPEPEEVTRVLTKESGLSTAYELEIVEGQGVICDSSFGLATVDLSQLRSGTFHVTRTSKTPLAFGTVTSCALTSDVAIISAGSNVYSFSIPDLNFIQKVPSANQNLKTLSVVGSYVFGYSVSSSFFSSRASLVVVNTAKSLLYTVEMILPTDTLLLTDAGKSSAPPYVVYENSKGNLYLLMAASTYLWAFEVIKYPMLSPTFTASAGSLIGRLTVSNTEETITAAYNFTIVEVAEFSIVPWKGAYPSQEYPRYTSIPVLMPTFSPSLTFNLPMSNYFTGQNVKYSLQSHDNSDLYDLKLSIEPRSRLVATQKLDMETSSDVTMTSYEGYGWVLLLVVAGNSNYATLVDGLLPTGTAKTTRVVCSDLRDIASAGKVTAVAGDPWVVLRCGSHWEVFSYSTNVDYQFSIADAGALVEVSCEYVFFGDETSVAVYDLKVGGQLVRVIDGQSTGLYTDFQVLQMTAGQFCGHVFVDSGLAGLLSIDAALSEVEKVFVVGTGVTVQYFDGYMYLLKVGDTFNLAQIDISGRAPVVTNVYPALTQCSSLQLAGTYAQLYLLCKGETSTALYVWNTHEEAYEALYTVISAESDSAIASVIVGDGLLYLYHNSKIQAYLIGQQVDSSSPLVPSFDQDGTIWGTITVTPNQPIAGELRVPFSLEATSATDEKSIELKLVIGTRGTHVKRNPAFNLDSSQLTTLQTVSVERETRTFSVPTDVFVGNGVNYYIRTESETVSGVYDCSGTTASICLEAKTVELVNNTGSALDFTVLGRRLYAVSATELTEIVYTEYPDWTVYHYLYTSIFDEPMTCDMIESYLIDSLSELIMRCFDSQDSAYLVVLNSQNLKVLKIQKLAVPPVLISVAVNPCAIYVYDKISVSQWSCATHQSLMTLSPETLRLSSFEVVNILQLHPHQILLALAEELVLVDTNNSPTVVSRLSLVSQINYKYKPRIHSAAAVEALILAVGSNSFLYKVEFNGTALRQVDELPSLFDDTAWHSTLGLLPEKTLAVYPVLQDNGDVQVAFANYSNPAGQYIYSYLHIDRAYLPPVGVSSKIAIMPSSKPDKYLVATLVRTLKTQPAPLLFLGLNTHLSVSFQPTPDKPPQTISLGGFNLATSATVGKLTVYFSDNHGKSDHHHHSSSSSSDDFLDKWWFWLIVGGVAVSIITALAILLIRLYTRKKARHASAINRSSFLSNTDL